ncbi:MAG TPA: acyl-CoA dehydrogenase family protein [Nocardioides sp.]|uniref:acyl-CoA dehydrogenase family protein n=1 Tax=Nocardioides sp. TaxID=35761 RepID=UPI002F415CE5
MSRALFEPEHEAFRETVATFLDKEAVPFHDQWEEDGIVDRDVWAKAGAQGLLGLQLPEEYGGGGTADFRYNAVVGEEMTRRGIYGCAFTLFNDMIAPYFAASATTEQAARWFPGLCAGTTIAAIAMTEPGAGSDLQGIRTTAVDEGDHYVLTGQKTFISNGILADLVVVVARTDPEAGHQGISLLVVERGMEGFERGRNLDKIGQHAQDTAELFFDHVRVPKENLLGEEGSGFVHLMTNLAQERLSIAVSAAAACEMLVETSLDYVKERTAFGRPIGRFQHTRFTLAEMATEAHIARVFIDDCLAHHVRGELDTATASMAKWWTTELQNTIVDRAVQLHGGYGYMTEYPVARAFVNSRVQTIYGGTTEIQKEIIGRSLGL